MRVWVLASLSVWFAFGGTLELQRAQRLYNHTDYAGAARLLSSVPEKDAATLEFLGQSYFMMGEYKKAAENLEGAIGIDPTNSVYYHWLGRTYGRRAETSFAVAAIGYAKKARANLEKAVELDPQNAEAVSDLFEYYLQAPGFLGGGFDKASKLASDIARRDAIEGHYAKARLAEERKEYSTAEAQLRRAIDLAPQQVGRVLDLAKFLAKQGRYDESDQTFVAAEKIAPNAPKVLFARADTYIKTKRNPDTARDLLKRYLASNLTPDDPPRTEAAKLLKQVSGS